MIRAIALAVVLAAVLAAPAHAGILTPDDATELAQSLAEAQEEQGICYGWQIDNDFSSSSDVGSSTGGPDQPLTRSARECEKGYVQLVGQIHYACNSCEDEDSASVAIDSDLDDPPTVKDLEGLGLDGGDLTGDKDDTTLVNMVNALPLIAADRGNAPYVAYEPATQVPATDRATNKPGSDLLRDDWFKLVLFGGLILAAPGFYLYKRSQQPPARSDEPPAPAPPRPPAPESTAPPSPAT